MKPAGAEVDFQNSEKSRSEPSSLKDRVAEWGRFAPGTDPVQADDNLDDNLGG